MVEFYVCTVNDKVLADKKTTEEEANEREEDYDLIVPYFLLSLFEMFALRSDFL
jgi:hypothetical protein